MSRQLNQFQQSYSKGQFAYDSNRNVMSCQIWSESTAILTPAMAVKLVDMPGHQITIDLAKAGDVVYGFVFWNFKRNSHKAGDIVEIAIESSMMHMEAAGAIKLGDMVTYTADDKVQVATTADPLKSIGVSLREAKVAGDLIAVHIGKLRMQI
jgi:uncharacterized protein YuzE